MPISYLSQNYRLNQFFHSNYKQVQIFKIAKFEFKVTLNYGLWEKQNKTNAHLWSLNSNLWICVCFLNAKIFWLGAMVFSFLRCY